MEQSITTSVRIPVSLKRDLDFLALHQHLKKNQIIISALREYTQKHRVKRLQDEIARQCARANTADQEEAGWDELAEESWA
ncbi:MAG: hypothetical protein R3E93_01950 [Thiothrix sp.]